MKVLAFDIATSTGVAWGTAGTTPQAATVDLGKGKSEDVRFARAIEVTGQKIQAYGPDLVVYEAPVGGPKTSHYLVGLAACVRGEARMLGHEPVQINIASYRKHFLGKHLTAKHFAALKPAQAKAAIKAKVIERCQLLGWDPRTDDEADAMALWDYACAISRAHQSVPAGGLFT